MKGTDKNPWLDLAARFMQTASRYPQRQGLHPGRSPGWSPCSYNELRQAALKYADDIAKNHPGDFVPVLADKSFECYAMILGALLAGKAYLPVNPKFPEERNRFMMEKAASGTSNASPSTHPPDKPAYLLFTSGTTGQPKGVAVSQGNVAAYLDFMLETYDFSPDDRFTQNFDLTFDLSVHDLFLCWSVGACLCVPDDSSSFGMARYIRETKPTVWFSVPSVVNLMDRMRLLKSGAFPSVRLSFFCGEPLLVKTTQAWKRAAADSRIINLYGPTEATIAITRYDLPEDHHAIKQELGIVSIGKIFDDNHYSLKTTADSTLEMTAEGELCLSGAQVVDGYFNNPEADRQSFFRDDRGDLWYKTGDLARKDEDGDLFFLGRLDSEVKISGYRVNLKEIESVLTGYDPVEMAVVMLDPKDDLQGRLVGFILTAAGENPREQDLDAYCKEHLPWYMVPGKYIFVDDFPLNQHGKVDRRALLKTYHDQR